MTCAAPTPSEPARQASNPRARVRTRSRRKASCASTTAAPSRKSPDPNVTAAIMRVATLVRLYACTLLGLSPVLLSHCGKATNGDLKGTETGNPPVVDSQKLRLVASGAGVEL